jgi:hypothetical protein
MTRKRPEAHQTLEDIVNMTALRFALILTLLVPSLAACHRRESAASGNTTTAATTQTIAPAAAQPAPTGTDAMTQTVEVEDSRSEEDGGVNSDNSGKATAKTARPSAKTKKH